MPPTPSPLVSPLLAPPRQFSSRRTQPGNLAGPLPYLSSAQMRQPTPRKVDLLSLPMEPEDARLTGGTRSLDRRLLALNLAGTRPNRTKSHAALNGTHPTAA